MLQHIAMYVATFLCAVFAGAALYVSLVEHPARLQCGPSLAVAEFRPSYRRGTVMQASCALLGSLAAIVACLAGASRLWALGGALLLSVVPFTLLVILPTNSALLDPSLDVTSPSAVQLLARWGRLHAVRTFLGLFAFALFLGLLTAGAP
jgi:anthrone oxygenase-like protein